MPNANSCNIIGNLTRDVEVRYSQKGTAIATICIAIDQGKDNEPIWSKVTVFGQEKYNPVEWIQHGRKGDTFVGINLAYDVQKWTDKKQQEQVTHGFKTQFGSQVSIAAKGAFKPQAVGESVQVRDNAGDDRQGASDVDEDSNLPF